MMDNTGKIIAFLGCECEIVKQAKDCSVIMEKYECLLHQGKSEGFTPLIIVPTNALCDFLEDDFPNYDTDGHINTIIDKAKSINVQSLLQKRTKEAMPSDGDTEYDIMGEFSSHKPVNKFGSLIDFRTKCPYEIILIAKIPTINPWELGAWIPMGGWNDCPVSEEQVAIFKYWHEKYRAFPTVVHHDIWEMYVEKPPETKEDAIMLALEQFGFCSDIVWQGVGRVNVLASTLMNAKTWYFWWD